MAQACTLRTPGWPRARAARTQMPAELAPREVKRALPQPPLCLPRSQDKVTGEWKSTAQQVGPGDVPPGEEGTEAAARGQRERWDSWEILPEVLLRGRKRVTNIRVFHGNQGLFYHVSQRPLFCVPCKLRQDHCSPKMSLSPSSKLLVNSPGSRTLVCPQNYGGQGGAGGDLLLCSSKWNQLLKCPDKRGRDRAKL